MLAKSNRLVRDNDIERLFAKGKRASCSFCGVRVLRTATKVARIAVVAPSKLSKNAVVRNRAKRRAREAVRPLVAKMIPGYDTALILFPAATKIPLPQMTNDLRRVFEKMRIL